MNCPIQGHFANGQLRQGDRTEFLDDRVGGGDAAFLDAFAVKYFWKLPGFVEQLEQLALGHAAIPLARILRKDFPDPDLISLGLGIIGLVLQNFTVGLEGALVISVKVTGPTFDQKLVHLVVLCAQTRGDLVDIAVSGVHLLRAEFSTEPAGTGVIWTHELFVLPDFFIRPAHVAGLYGDERTASQGACFGFLNACLIRR